MSKLFDDLFGKLFTNPDKPIRHHENFTLEARELSNLEKWMQQTDGKDTLDRIYRSYHLKRSGIQEQPQVHVFESDYANGFAVTYEAPLTADSFANLFLALSRRVLALGYKQVSLDRKMEEINEQVKITEKFYLKPPLQLPKDGAPISQLFGNVSIEKISLDNQPSYLKFLATVYSDRLYQPAGSFEELMELIFQEAS